MDARSLKFEIDGYQFHLMFAEYSTRPDHKTRIYVSGADEITEMEQPPYTTIDDDPEVDRQWRRYNKLELVKMREVLDVGMALIADLLSNQAETIKFSRKAGCSCPCSPGFVADRPLRTAGDYRQIESMWITKVQPQTEPPRTLTMADFDLDANAKV
jgi:hypothetical protein